MIHLVFKVLNENEMIRKYYQKIKTIVAVDRNNGY